MTIEEGRARERSDELFNLLELLAALHGLFHYRTTLNKDESAEIVELLDKALGTVRAMTQEHERGMRTYQQLESSSQA